MRYPAVARAAVKLAMFAALAGAGCEASLPRPYPAEGKVTLPDGSPLKGGRIETLSPAGEKGKRFNSQGEIGRDGSFRLSTFKEGDGALPGVHQVIVLPVGAPTARRDVPEPAPNVHRRFARYQTSGLTLTIEPKPNLELLLTVSPP